MKQKFYIYWLTDNEMADSGNIISLVMLLTPFCM